MAKNDKPPLPESIVKRILEEMESQASGPFANYELSLEDRQINWLADFIVRRYGDKAEQMAIRYCNDLKQSEFAIRVLAAVCETLGARH
ncbi:hypothetical protein [Pseudaminobacter salicylatoxidans]|uniref:hypothetical protein n=1 Tax=Pseudaminobacter salicylatoxidans TaxID=93369 RepID=UPI0003694948|nr:hypothetical protein [Pseudaminobacter salicylatoxidans]